MDSARRSRMLRELQVLISKIPMHECCAHVASEFGLYWVDISRAVRRSRLPMTSSSIASVLCKYAAKSLTAEEVAHIIARLRLQAIAMKPRIWHLINLMEKIIDVPVNRLVESLPSRVKQALKNGVHANKKAQVQIMKLGEVFLMSIQLESSKKESSVLYVATPPGQPRALVSTLHSNLLRPCVQGLGYKTFIDAGLNGKDIPSLFRIANSSLVPRNCAAMMGEAQEYNAMPYLTRGGIDFTNTQPLRQYLVQRFGPDPPILDSLEIVSEMQFSNRQLLDKKIKVTMQVKSENTLAVISKWAEIGVTSPHSKLFDMIYNSVSNKIHVVLEDDDEDDAS